MFLKKSVCFLFLALFSQTVFAEIVLFNKTGRKCWVSVPIDNKLERYDFDTASNGLGDGVVQRLVLPKCETFYVNIDMNGEKIGYGHRVKSDAFSFDFDGEALFSNKKGFSYAIHEELSRNVAEWGVSCELRGLHNKDVLNVHKVTRIKKF